MISKYPMSLSCSDCQLDMIELRCRDGEEGDVGHIWVAAKGAENQSKEVKY